MSRPLKFYPLLLVSTLNLQKVHFFYALDSFAIFQGSGRSGSTAPRIRINRDSDG